MTRPTARLQPERRSQAPPDSHHGTARNLSSTLHRRYPRTSQMLSGLALLCLFAGCTQKFSGVEEYKQLTKRASAAVQNAVHSLENVSPRSGRPAAKLVANFERDLQRLQVDSIQV